MAATRCSLLLISLIFFSTLLHAQEADVPLIIDDQGVADESWFTQHVQQSFLILSTRSSNRDSQQEAEIMLPFALNEEQTRFLFTGLNYNHRDDGSYSFSGSLGLGYLLADEELGLRLRAHGDVTETGFDHQIAQLGLGLDVYTRFGIDMVANYYLAEDASNAIARMQRTTFDDPFAAGHSIFQGQNDATLTTFESALRGADIKAKFEAPLLSEIVPAEAFVGAYAYDGVFKDDLRGMMAGISFQPFQRVAVGAEYYGDEEFYGDNWVFHARVSVPLGGEGGLLGGLKRAFSRVQPEALANRNVRDRLGSYGFDRRNWVMTEISDPIQTEFVQSTKTIASNVIFVNNGGAVGNGIQTGSAAGTGSAENPVNTIQSGAQRLVSTLGGAGMVYVQAANPYVTAADQNIEVGHGAGAGVTSVYFASSLNGVQACGGHVFGGNTGHAVVANGGFDLRGGANGSTSFARVEGFQISGGITNAAPMFGVTIAGSGISAADVATLIANSNIIDGVLGHGIAHEVETGPIGISNIFDNQVRNTGNDGIRIDMDDSVTSQTVMVTNNSLANTANDGLEVDLDSQGQATVNIVGNQFLNIGSQGIIADVASDGGMAMVAISGNQLNGTGSEGIDINPDSDSSAISHWVVSNNIVQNAGAEGLEIDYGVADTGVGTLLITGNQFLNSANEGIELDTDWDDIGSASIVITNNLINGTGGTNDGMHLNFDRSGTNTGTATFDLTGNTILNAGGDSIEMDANFFGGGRILTVTGGNNISAGAGSGFSFNDLGTPDAIGGFSIDGNAVNFPAPGNIVD